MVPLFLHFTYFLCLYEFRGNIYLLWSWRVASPCSPTCLIFLVQELFLVRISAAFCSVYAGGFRFDRGYDCCADRICRGFRDRLPLCSALIPAAPNFAKSSQGQWLFGKCLGKANGICGFFPRKNPLLRAVFWSFGSKWHFRISTDVFQIFFPVIEKKLVADKCSHWEQLEKLASNKNKTHYHHYSPSSLSTTKFMHLRASKSYQRS